MNFEINFFECSTLIFGENLDFKKNFYQRFQIDKNIWNYFEFFIFLIFFVLSLKKISDYRNYISFCLGNKVFL